MHPCHCSVQPEEEEARQLQLVLAEEVLVWLMPYQRRSCMRWQRTSNASWRPKRNVREITISETLLDTIHPDTGGFISFITKSYEGLMRTIDNSALVYENEPKSAYRSDRRMWGKRTNPCSSQNAENASDAGSNTRMCTKAGGKEFAEVPNSTALGISYTESTGRPLSAGSKRTRTNAL
jgi:hypothetical protein